MFNRDEQYPNPKTSYLQDIPKGNKNFRTTSLKDGFFAIKPKTARLNW